MIFRARKARRRILIVEDDWAVLEVLKLMLEDDGHVVVTVAEGKQAVAAASAKPFDLILMDISMPGMSGIEVAQALRGDARTRDMLIAIHTGLDEHWVRERFVDYDLFLTKAADTDVLVDEIRRLFEQPPLSEERRRGQRRDQRHTEADDSTFTMTEAIRAQQALREAMGLGDELVTMEALVDLLDEEIDQLRRLGEKDEEIVRRIEKAVGRALPSGLSRG